MDSDSSGAGAVGGIFLLVFFGVGTVLYFVPLIVAVLRKHPQILAIGVLNFLLGWTMIGWVGALVWAFVQPQPAINQNFQQFSPPYPQHPQNPQPYPQQHQQYPIQASYQPPPPSFGAGGNPGQPPSQPPREQ